MPTKTTRSANAKPKTSELDALGVDMLAVVGRLHRWATRHATLPVSPAQARLLAQVEELAPARIGDLARADHCSQPTMTTQVKRLEELGLLARASDPADARAVLITLTAQGRRLLRRTRAARAAVVLPLLQHLDADERAHLQAAVAVLGRALDDVTPSR